MDVSGYKWVIVRVNEQHECMISSTWVYVNIYILIFPSVSLINTTTILSGYKWVIV